MSCNSDTSCDGRGSFLKFVILLLVGAFLLTNYKEIVRYIKISSM